MSISREVRRSLDDASWIRRMFEEGNKLRKVHGADQVFDFSLGNPDLEPPEQLKARLAELASESRPGIHKYMPNSGWPEVREKIAGALRSRTGVPFTLDHLVMTVGAGGALNVLMKALLDPGDEVIVLVPYFAEYRFYISNPGGVMVGVETKENFTPDLDALGAAIGPRTRAVLINSPNNPTGVVYSLEQLRGVAEVLTRASKRHGRPIYLVSDEPYRRIVYDGIQCPEIAPLYPDFVLVTSHSKDLGLAGERIGYLAISPRAAAAADLFAACTFCNRTLGFVNAPSLFQLAVADLQDLAVDVSIYQRRRDLLVGELRGLGLRVDPPGGAFYLFPRSPIPDETQFIARLVEERILVVPGRGFGRPGYFRISYAVPTTMIERSLPAWKRVLERREW